jgi:hypothetical protein
VWGQSGTLTLQKDHSLEVAELAGSREAVQCSAYAAKRRGRHREVVESSAITCRASTAVRRSLGAAAAATAATVAAAAASTIGSCRS